MRSLKWQFAAVLALLPMVFGQLSPVYAADSAPTATTSPVITSDDELISGNTLTFSTPDWTATPEPTITRQWYSCAVQVATESETLAAGCAAIAGATGSTFTLSNAQKAKFLVVGSFASNALTGATPVARYSASTLTAVSAAPSLKASVLGTGATVKFTKTTTASLNSKYSVDLTGWVIAQTYLYKWYRCEAPVVAAQSEPQGCALISGATASSYTVTSNDVDRYVTAFVTAKNGTTQLATITIASGTTVNQTPVNLSPATAFNGVVVVGSTITALDGSWASSPQPEFTYQWYSCSAAVPAAAVKNTKCLAIAGQTRSNLVVTSGFNNKYLVVQVKATNSTNVGAPVSSFSASTTKVLTAPVNTVAPRVASSQTTSNFQPIAGGTLSVIAGTWTGNPAPVKTYQWYSCDFEVAAGLSAVPSDCVPLAGATTTSLVSTPSMQGKFVVAEETATNLAGSTKVVTVSANSVQVKPSFSSDPTLAGSAASGSAVSATSNASDFGGVPSESYAWAKCPTPKVSGSTIPTGCTLLAGQTDAELTLDPSLEGLYVLARVTLNNIAGQTTRTTATSEQILGPIVNLELTKPTSTRGFVQLGVAVQANDGQWSGFPQPSFSYSWHRCNQAVDAKSTQMPEGCEAIDGAIGRTYTPVSADASGFLSVRVTAIQGLETTSIWSPTSDRVLEAPSFSGTPAVGSQHVVGGANLVPVIGSIRGTTEPRSSFAWYRCSAPVNADSAALAVGCSAIAGATLGSYAFGSADVGKYILAAVTLTNEIGTAKRYTSSSQQVSVAPANLTSQAPVSESLPPKVGTLLTAGANTWTGNPAAGFTYQWFRCDSVQKAKTLDLPLGCVAIGGQTARTYSPAVADAGKYLLLAVRGFNEHGSQTAYSPSTLDIAEPPSFVRGPALNSLRNKGDNLEVATAEVSGWPTPVKTLRWFRCDSKVEQISTAVPAGCLVITGATGATYRLQQLDVQKYVLAEVKIKNSVGQVINYVPSSQQIWQVPEVADTVRMTGNQWVGQTLTANGISVAGFPTPVTTLQWIRCPAAGTPILSCLPIATGTNTYKLTTADRGAQIVVKVSSKNDAAITPTEVISPFTSAIKMPPKLIGGSFPAISGLDGDGEARAATAVTAFEGFWDATPAVDQSTDFAYQWYLCSLRHPVSTGVIPPDCLPIKNQALPTYTVKFTDKEQFLGFSVKVSNGTDDVLQFSTTSARVYAVPLYMSGAKTSFGVNQAATDGAPRVGYEIEATVGTWQGSPTPTYTYQWFSCTKAVTVTTEALGDLCQVIVGATGRVLTIGPEQIGQFLGVAVTGSYKTYFDEVYSTTTTKSVVSPPVNSVIPRITNRFTYVHSTLKTTEGAWVGSPEPVQAHSWWECDEPLLEATSVQPSFCRELPSSSGNWKITPAQDGKYLASLTTSTNTAGIGKIWSASTVQIVTGSVNIKAPTVGVVAPSVAFVGSQFPSTLVDLRISDALQADWVGTPNPVLADNEYSWYRCSSAVTESSDVLSNVCQLIEINASSQSYRPIVADVGMYLVGAVRNDNGVGASIVYTTSTDPIQQPPKNTIAPTITGNAFVDQPLTAVDGSWEGLPSPTYKLQWLACDSQQLISLEIAPSGCAEIAKATTGTFTPTDELLGKYLVLRTTASNKVGEQIVWSVSTSAVVSGPVKKQDPKFTYPATVTTPVKRLNPIVGMELATDGGVWKGVPEPLKSYQWLACPAAVIASALPPTEDLNCEILAGETSSTIIPAENTRGKFLMVHVHAVNENGEADFYSATTSVVWMAPIVDQVVVASGTSFHRLTLKAKQDTWKAFPDVTKTYEWFVCANPVSTHSLTLPLGCEPIPGATANKYKIPDAAVWPHTHEYLVVKVRASNAVNFSEHYSATSSEILVGPVNEKAPTIAGSTLFTAGSTITLTGNAGVWSPVESSLTYQWYRCESVLLADDELDPKCVPVQGANSINYQLTDVDPGKSMVLSVTGENNNLRSTTYSASTALVTERVRNVVAPSITGVPRVNEISTGVDGDWRGFPTITKTKSWYACTTRLMAPVVSSSVPATCKLLSGANTDTLTNDVSDIGKYLVYAVSATNKVSATAAATTVKVFSAATEAVADPPVFNGRPTFQRPAGTALADAPRVGSVWRAVAKWTNSLAPTMTYQWYRCGAYHDTVLTPITEAPEGCSPISAASEVTYTIRVEDQNQYLMVSVTGTNAAGQATGFTNTTEQVFQAPFADPLPSISGSHTAGSTLTIDPGVWSPSNVVLSYNWYRCTGAIPATTSEQPPRNVAGNFCTSTTGNGLTYTVDELDNGFYITAQVVAVNGDATTSYLIGVTEGVSQAPINITAPTIRGDAYLVGLVLSAASDQWAAMPAPTKTYQWYSCTARVTAFATALDGSCAAISGAVASSYQIDRDLTGKYIVVAVTASNGAGTSTVYSASTDISVEAGYEPGTSSVTVTANAGNTQITETDAITFLQTPGTWTHGNDVGQPITNRRWLFCSEPITEPTARFPADCDFIYPYAVSSTKKLDSRETQDLNLDFDTDFAGYYISMVEYVLKPASNPLYDVNRQAFRIARTSERITIAPRIWDDSAVFTEPTVTRSSIVGTASTVAQVDEWQSDTDQASLQALPHVTWRGAEAGTFTYQWFSCASLQLAMSQTGLGAGCSNIDGATTSSFTPTVDEVREYLGVQITATNSAGSYSVWTKTSEKVTQRPTLVSGGEPTLNNITFTQDVATVNPGTWQGEPAPTFTYKWFLCGPGVPSQVTTATVPAGCSVLGGNGGITTSPSMVVPSLGGQNVDKRLVVQVIANNKPFVDSPNTNAETRASVTSVALKEKPYFASMEPVVMTTSPTTSVFAPNVGETLTMVNDQSKWYATPVEAGGLSFSYSWYTCGLSYQALQRTETLNSDCVVIAGETGRSITLTRALSGTRILGKISATSNDSGWGASAPVTGFATSATPQVRERPFKINPPTLSVANGAQPQVGLKISGYPGDWGGFPQPQVDSNSYLWFMCDNVVPASGSLQAGCSLIPTPTSNSSYTPSNAQAGKYIVFSAQVSNTVNPNLISTDRQYSAAFGPILMAPEISFASPAFTGSAHVGQVLTTTMPTSRAFPTATSTSFEWFHCQSNSATDANTSIPSGCLKIGETNQTSITVDETMAGRYIEIYAVSTNTVKTVRKNTFSSKYVTKSPTNVVAPTISGSPLVNGTNKYVATIGRWSANPAISLYGYTWYLCTSSNPSATTVKPASCATSGVSGTTIAPTQLLLTRDMAGKYLLLEESATQTSNNIDSNRTGKIYSASSTQILSPPLFEGDSTISGNRHVGEELTATMAAASGYPDPTISIQWYACTSPVTSKTSHNGFGCTEIAGATSETFTPTSNEVDRYVTFGAKATALESSVFSYAVSGNSKITQTPSAVVAPSIAGETLVGVNQTITATTGTWEGSAPIVKTFNWYFCDSAVGAATETIPSDCTLISAAGGLALTTSALPLTSNYRGKHIVAVEIATNTSNKPNSGRAQMVSASLGPINMAPVFDQAPTVSGIMHVGETLSAVLPAVASYPTSSLVYEWWSCTSPIATALASLPSTCNVLAGFEGDDLLLTNDLAGKYVAVSVTATNDHGEVSKSSVAAADITRTPVNNSAALLTGSPVVGATNPLRVATGGWDSAPVATAGDYSYSWYQCSSEHASAPTTVPVDCALISGQSASTLLPANESAGKHILAKVTLTVRTNKVGSGSASTYTASTGPVRNRPAFGSASPTITGIAHLGETLSATLAPVTGSETPESTYQWWLCTDVVAAGSADITANCTAIADSDGASLVITSNLVGKRIALLQTATNNQGAATKSSATTVPVSATPSVTVAPVISGSDRYSATSTSSVTVSTGTWSGYPSPVSSNFTYAWYSCPTAVNASQSAPSGCTSVAAAASSALTLTSTMAGRYLVAKVSATTATNKVGTGSAATYSASFGPIRVAPTNSTAPSFSPSTVIVGRTISANVGVWSGTGPITYTYKWYSCPTTAKITSAAPVPSTCALIANFDTVSLVVPATVAKKKLLLAVTATNSAGSTVKSVISGATVTAASVSPLALRAIL